VQVVSTTAIGQGYKLVLDSVTIVSDPAFPNETADFAFDSTGTQILKMSDVLQNGDVRTYKIRYTPTTTGNKHARIIYSYHRQDDPTITAAVDTTIVGTGLTEHTTLSAAKDPANPSDRFNAKTSLNIDVPIQMTAPIASTAQIDHIVFDLSFTQDQFNPGTGINNPWLVGANGYNVTYTESNAGGITTLHVTAVAPAGGVTSATKIADLNLQVALARTKGSNFVISNAGFYTANSPDTVCYVGHDSIPGVFDPTDVCGDSTMRQYMITDKLRFTMDNVRPNPAQSSVTIGLNVADNATPISVEMFNAVGEKVRTFEGQTLSTGRQDMNLDLTGLPQGPYTVRVSTPGQMGSQMVLIQR
jgi:hypothetical protein